MLNMDDTFADTMLAIAMQEELKFSANPADITPLPEAEPEPDSPSERAEEEEEEEEEEESGDEMDLED